jgi:hypothetical protein
VRIELDVFEHEAEALAALFKSREGERWRKLEAAVRKQLHKYRDRDGAD